VLGVTAAWLLIAAFALSLTRAARRGDLPADRHVRERSLPPPPQSPVDHSGHGYSADDGARRRRYITDPVVEERAVEPLARPDD